MGEKIMLSICGVNCITDCKAFQKECYGCNELQGKVPWSKYYGKKKCPIYECAQERKLKSCGDCGLAPCRVWYETRNPKVSDKAFSADLKSRLANLTKQLKAAK